jgi:multidrug resistance efflux pump
MRGRFTRGGSRQGEGTGRTKRRQAFLAELRRAAAGGPVTPRAAAPATPAARAIVPATAVPAREVAPRPSPRAPAPAAPPAATRPQIFRAEAMRHRLSAEEGRGVIRIAPPWAWAIVCCVVAALAAALVASIVGQVEVTTRGRGILRPTAGVRALTSQAGGTVAKVEARSGQVVRAGAVLLRIDAPDVQAQVLEADRQLEALRTQFSGVAAQQDQHYAEQIESLRARARRTEEQITSLRGTVKFQERRVAADAQLVAKGLLSELAAGDGRESLAQAQRQLSGAEQSLDQTRQELASLEGRRQDDLWQRQQAISAAQNRRDSLALQERQSVVTAPEDGTVDALSARVGEVVRAGQTVGKLIPAGSPLQVVAFLAERDRGFVKPGDEVRLELDQLPHAEYGTLRARIARIGDDLASPAEIREALGDEQKLEAPSYRVELEITDATPAEAAHVTLRTGGLMDVRYTLRRQRLITLVFTPLARFFR